MKRILILGVNGFIGHHLSKRILATTDWDVFGMDMQADRIEDVMEERRFHFFNRSSRWIAAAMLSNGSQ